MRLPSHFQFKGRGLSLRRNLGIQMLALYMLFIGPVLAGALIFNTLARMRLTADVKSADLALAQAIALETGAALQNAEQTVVNLAQQPPIRTADIAAMRQIFGHVAAARNDINLIYRLDDHGVMVYHYPEGERSTVGFNFSFRQYYQDALRTAEPRFSSGRLSPTTGKPVATVVMPLYDEEDVFLGIIATNLALEKLSETLAKMARTQPAGMLITIIDQAGQVIAYPGLLQAELPDDMLLPEQPEEDEGLPKMLLPDWDRWQDGVVTAVLAGETGAVVSQAPDGSEWLRSYVPILVAGWGVLVQRPTEVAFATIDRFHRMLIASIILYLIGGVIFWLLLSRRVIVPLEQLAEFSRRVGNPQPGRDRHQIDLAPWSQRQDQIGHLATSLTTMAENIDRRFIEQSTLLETGRAVVSTLETSEVIESILDAVQRLLSVERCAIVTLDERLGVFRIRASRGLPEDYVRNLRIEPSDPKSPAVRALRTQTQVLISDTETEASYQALRIRAREEGYRSLLAVPLLTQHAPPAVLVLYNPEPHHYADTELELIASFANHAAMAMENAALYSRSDAQLQEQTRRLEAIVESLNDGLILEGLGGRVLFCNQRAADLLGIRRSLVRRRDASTLIEALLSSANDAQAAEQAVLAARQGKGARTVDFTRTGHDGRPQDLRSHFFEVTDARGELIGRGQLWQDITHDKDVDRMKSALVSTVSHELRTPLAAIKGYATTLLAEDVEWDGATQRQFLQTISDESDRLAVFVNNLLDLSRLEGGSLQIHLEPYHVGELIHEAVQREEPRLSTRLNLDIDPDLPVMALDGPRVETVLRNLLENADKYAPPDTAVELSAQRRNGDVVVWIRDYGPGVPKELHGKIFDRYYRAEMSRTRGMGGAGLGLAICKGFVEAHGGRIWVQDGHPGSVFAFSLPIEQHESAAPTKPKV